MTKGFFDTMVEGMKLTPKQEAFCMAYVETGNASEAYRRAYDVGNMKAATVNRTAKELLDNPKITARIAALQAEHRERHNITIDSLTDELEAARQLAFAEGKASAAVAATMGKAKLHGLLKDTHEHTGPDGEPISFTVVLVEPKSGKEQ